MKKFAIYEMELGFLRMEYDGDSIVYNRVNKTEYTPDDLYDIATNVIVSCWVYDYNESYGIYGTEKKIIAYNEGHVYAKKKETSNYLDKVNKKMLYFNK